MMLDSEHLLVIHQSSSVGAVLAASFFFPCCSTSWTPCGIPLAISSAYTRVFREVCKIGADRLRNGDLGGDLGARVKELKIRSGFSGGEGKNANGG